MAPLLFSEYEQSSPQFDADKSKTRGKIFILDSDITGDGHINIDDLHWEYLKSDGDFRSEEVTALRDEADIIVTNPPFSLFREFLAWITDADKQFIIIGNINAITYPQAFPLIMADKMWLGVTIHSGDREFEVPQEYPLNAAGWRVDETGRKFIRVKGVRWFTNIDHGDRHEPLDLMTMTDNIRFSRHKDIVGKEYRHYINYDAIEIPYGDAIPSDYDGAMGVPITFLDKYCPDQFEILGIDGGDMGASYGISANLTQEECNALFREHKGFRRGKLCYRNDDGRLEVCYRRILIRKR
ncbi:adenine-specific methyltransferase EcoRI family protein [uncultured Phocaeicola sp.]|uniref:adenine-specific methyltransferase EcoRI family protein n=1 Tax=uncultured Phocaeicola sp. TaxID=990718 RepID=UPI00339CF6E6